MIEKVNNSLLFLMHYHTVHDLKIIRFDQSENIIKLRLKFDQTYRN